MSGCSRVLLALLFTSVTTGAQGTAAVPIGDPMYRSLDVLIDAGWVHTAIVGQRPYSRAAVASMMREARGRMDSAQTANAEVSPLIRASLALLSTRLRGAALPDNTSPGRVVAHVESVVMDIVATDSRTRAVPGNGLGTTEADLNTLTDHAEGRSYETGWNVGLESEQWLELPHQIGFQVQPRLWTLVRAPSGAVAVQGEILSGGVRAVVGNAAVMAGREYTVWSQADGAGLMFSDNAPALDMIRVSSDRPFSLPSVLSRLGLVAGTIQLATLGASDSNSHSLLVSYKLSAKPSETTEIGASFENHFGGVGAPSTSLVARLLDLSPFLDVFRQHPDSTDIISDKLMGLDGRWRLRSLANMTFFGEVALEDFDPKRLRSIFTEDAAYSAGIIIPELPGRVSARVAYHTVGLRFYEHHLLTNGIASRRFVLGDNLDHDASGWVASAGWVRDASLGVRVDVAREVRHNDPYQGVYTLPGRLGLVFERVGSVPAESRSRASVTVTQRALGGGMELEGSASLERTVNFAFALTRPELHALGRVAIRRYW